MNMKSENCRCFYRQATLTPLICFLVFFSIRTAFASENRLSGNLKKIEKLQGDLESIRLKIEFLNIQVRESKTHVRDLEKRITRQKQRVSELEAQYESYSQESDRINTQIYELNAKIDGVKAMIRAIIDRFKNRLVHLHKIRQGTLVGSIFAARDVNAFLNRFQMIRYLLKYDRKILAELRQNHEILDAHSRDLSEKRTRLEELSSLNKKNREELLHGTSSLSAMMEALLIERKLFLEKQEELRFSENALEGEISRIENERSKSPVIFDQIFNEPHKPAIPKVTPRIASAASSAELADMTRNSFMWPVSGVAKLSFRYGNASEPKALIMGFKGEREILAAQKGRVSFKGPLGQLGNVIILGHAQGFSSVYGNLSDIWVGLNQIVETGEVMGKINGFGNPALYFELRFSGKNRNPMDFLPALAKRQE